MKKYLFLLGFAILGIATNSCSDNESKASSCRFKSR